MGIKVKKSPKPATNESPPKKTKVAPGLKEKRKKTQGSSAKKAALKMTVRLPDAADTTSCELKRTQVCHLLYLYIMKFLPYISLG